MWETLSFFNAYRIQEFLAVFLSFWMVGIFNKNNCVAASCQPSSLPPSVRTAGTCGYREGEVCSAKCERNGITFWTRKIQCLKNGQWSPTPICSEGNMKESLEMVDCRKLNVKKSNAGAAQFCFKITSRITPKKCPQLWKHSINLTECSRDVGSDCLVSCEQNPFTIRCLPNGLWSHVPKCVSSRQRTCPEPVAVTFANCSNNERCKVVCPDGKMLGGEVMCLPSGMWSFVVPSSYHTENTVIFSSHNMSDLNLLSKCSCLPPNTNDEITTADDCTDRKIGDTCHFLCKNPSLTIDHKTAICLKNLSWSYAPKCSKKTCPPPQLTAELSFKEDCSSKTPGQDCKLACNGMAEVNGKHPFRCVNGTHWSKLPHCVCPPPLLPSDTRAAEDCMEKKLGEMCRVTCEGESPSDLKFIMCQRNGTWTSIPPCKSSYCIRPDLPQTLTFKDDCSSKKIGETCFLECLNVPETHEIKCLSNTQWSTFPECSCLKPILSSSVESKEECLNKKPGEKCKVSCKEALHKIEFLICLNNSQWTEEPKCNDLYCPVPQLPSYLRAGEICSRKETDETCKLVCKFGGSFVSEDYIRCIKGKHWTDFPVCTCPIPDIQANLEIIGECYFKKPREFCELKCNKGYKLFGKSSIHCLENSTWSTLPTCSLGGCPNPKIPDTLLFADVCIDKYPGDICSLKCKEGGNIIGKKFISCLNETHWSEIPKCACPRPNLKSGLKSVSDCDFELPGSKCFLKCDSGPVSGNNFIICENNTKWSDQPDCATGYCKEPSLEPYIIADASCSFKLPGDECQVRCEEGGIILGNSTIKCLNETHWTKAPECGCPKPVLDDDIESTNGDCSRMKVGQRCELKCKSLKKLIGDPFIACQKSLRWSSQPICKIQICSNPLPLEGILKPRAGDDCRSKSVNSSCTLECSEGGNMIGPNTITCLNQTHWSKLPDCTCLQPKLTEYLKFDENCDNKARGDKCKVSCEQSKKLVGNNTIVCKNNTKWSSFPTCVDIFCPEPLISREILKEHPTSCMSKRPGESCTLICKEGGKIIGNSSLECLKNGTWSKEPDCNCPKPILVSDLITKEVDECASKRRGETCEVSCKNMKKISGKSVITCRNNTQWSPQPRCDDFSCSAPNLPPVLRLNEINCSKKFPGDSCKIMCSNGGRVIGENTISCLNNLKWSNYPKCTCPNPVLRPDLRAGNCKAIHPGRKCAISCKDLLSSPSENFITCNLRSTWGPLPICRKTKCDRPKNLKAEVQLRGLCEIAQVFNINATCNVSCKNLGNLVGNNQITCLEGNHWSESPFCSCPPPKPEPGLIFKSCNQTLPGQPCEVSCINGIASKNVIRCELNYSWEAYPTCICPPPTLEDMYDIRDETGCRSKKMKELCLVGCRHTRKLFYLTCLPRPDILWSPPEICSNPNRCEKIEDYMNHYKISISQNCQNKSEFKPDEFCTLKCNQPGTVLDFRSERGEYLTELAIRCLETGLWYPPFLKCSCPPFIETDEFFVSPKCSLGFQDDICDINCKRTELIKYPSYRLKCNGIAWLIESPLANQLCEFKSRCPDPRNALAEKALTLTGECTDKQNYFAGDTCTLECFHRAAMYPENGFIACEDSGRFDVWATWSNFPRCACPRPTLFPPLEFRSEDKCVKVFQGEKCFIDCDGAHLMRAGERNYIECLGAGVPTWESYQPACDPKTCQIPSLRKHQEWFENCERKKSGQKCQIKCEGIFRFGNTMAILHNITCINGTWERSPPCVCERFVDSPPQYRALTDCTSASQFEQTGVLECVVECMQTKEVHKLFCTPTGKWSSFECRSPPLNQGQPQLPVPSRWGRSAMLEGPPSDKGSYLTKYQGRSHPCDTSHEIGLHWHCLYLTDSRRGWQGPEACNAVFKMKKRAWQHLLAPWFQKKKIPCVWTGIDNRMEVIVQRHVDGFPDQYESYNDRSIETRNSVARRMYCIVMLSKIDYNFAIVDCESLKCPFLCIKQYPER